MAIRPIEFLRKGFPPFLLLLAGTLLLAAAPVHRRNLLPLVRSVHPLSDTAEGGLSSVRVLAHTREHIVFTWQLHPGARYPWAGLKLVLAEQGQPPLDMSSARGLHVRLQTRPSASLRLLTLSRPDPQDTLDRLPATYHAVEVASSPGKDTLLPWSAFRIPSWIRQRRNLQIDQDLEALHRVRALEIQSYMSLPGKDTVQVEIRSLHLEEPVIGLRILALALMAGGLALALRPLLPTPSPKTHPPEPAPVPEEGAPAPSVRPTLEAPQTISLPDPRKELQQQVLGLLQKRFQDPELNLEALARELGLPARQAASLLKESTGLHFKGALNELRLSEAARLLSSPRGTVSEIAYAVGFQNPSHFGRAFRERFGCSPSEFRSAPEKDASSL